MKRILTWCLCLTLAVLCTVPAMAAVNDAALPRVLDEAEWLEQEELNNLNDYILENGETYGVDCPIFILLQLPDGVETLSGYNDAVYRDYGYGCGDDRACVMLTLNVSESVFTIDSYRGAGAALSDEERDALSDRFIQYMSNGDLGIADVLRSYALDAALTASGMGGASVAPVQGVAKPDWYPADVTAFTDFHNDASVSRVVDNADLFTPQQEAEMAAKIAEIQQTYNYDFVVYTDDSSYGLDRGVWAADFYQFNGYGYGDDYSGGVLFICMEPGNRGWWTAARGGYRNLFTEENCKAIDDRLEPYMHKGADGDEMAYGEGVLGYLDDTSELMRTGKVPKTLHFGLPIAAGIVAFLLGGGITSGVLRSNMKTVRHAEQAHEYLVDRSFHLRRSNDFFLNRTVSRTLRQKEEKSGGGSSYSGGYSSSGGGSFSGGGRGF